MSEGGGRERGLRGKQYVDREEGGKNRKRAL